MKLERLYRDIFSTLNIDRGEKSVYALDVINTINDTISEIIREYAGAGIGEVFAVTQSIQGFFKDPNYPFVFTFVLDYPINQDLNTSSAILSSYFKGSDENIVDEEDSAEKGDVRYKKGRLFTCVESYNNLNTFQSTFDPTTATEFFPENGLVYKEGTITYDVATKTWWRATEDYTNDNDQEINETGIFEKLYWKEIGNADFEGNHVSLKQLNTSRLSNDINDYHLFTVKYDKVFSNTSNPLVITYIPEWEYTKDLNKELKIPESIALTIKQRCVQFLSVKLGIPQQEDSDG